MPGLLLRQHGGSPPMPCSKMHTTPIQNGQTPQGGRRYPRGRKLRRYPRKPPHFHGREQKGKPPCVTTDQSRHTREPVPATGADSGIIHYSPPKYQGGKIMDMNEVIPGLQMTCEEFLKIYHSADVETQREIRKLLGLEE